MQKRFSVSPVFLMLMGLFLPALALAADLGHARDLLNQAQYEAAALEANRYLAEHPGDTQARFIRGLALARAGRVDAAIRLFQALADEYPELAEPRNNLGVLYARQGRFELARAALVKAVEINPRHGPAQENLGDVYLALARNAFEKASGIEKDNRVVREKRERLQALLNAPRGDEYADTPNAPAQAGAPEPEAGQAATPEATPAATFQDKLGGGSAGPENEQIRAAALAWASAWSSQDVTAYLNAYSEAFRPVSGQSRTVWARERRNRVSSPRSIDVDLSDTRVDALGDGQHIISFMQRYRSDSYQDRERKALLMRQENGAWKILREDSPGAVRAYAQRGRDFSQVPETLAPVTVSSSGNEQDNEAIRELVNGWAQAWSNQDLDGYFAAYSKSFNPEGGQSLSAWIRERQARISTPESISVRIDNLRIENSDADTAQAHFTQWYRSGTYNDRVNKTLRLQREPNGWHIVHETTD